MVVAQSNPVAFYKTPYPFSNALHLNLFFTVFFKICFLHCHKHYRFTVLFILYQTFSKKSMIFCLFFKIIFGHFFAFFVKPPCKMHSDVLYYGVNYSYIYREWWRDRPCEARQPAPDNGVRCQILRDELHRRIIPRKRGIFYCRLTQNMCEMKK